MANPTSMALIPWRSDRQLVAFDMNLGPGRLLHQAYSVGGRWVEKRLGEAGHKLGMGPSAVSLRIEKAFGDDPLTRQSKLDSIYFSFQKGTNTQRDRALNRECQKLLEYALPSQSPVTQAETFKQIITLTTRYPGLGRLFLQCPDISRVAYSPDAICEFWRNKDHHYDTESKFLLNFASNCLARIEPNIGLEGIRPSKLGCASEKVPGVIERLLARHSDSDGGSCFARLIAIRYIATILELPAFWSENYQIQKITMDTLCKQTLLFIEDINPDSVSADDFEAVLFDPDGIDALADAILVGGKHWLQRQPELTESGPPYWLASFVKLVKILRGLILPSLLPMAHRRAAEDWEALLRVVERKLSMESSLDQFEDVYAFVKKCSGILPSLMKSSDVVPNFDAKGFSPLEASETRADFNADEFKTDSSKSPSTVSPSVKSDTIGLEEAKTFYTIPPLRVTHFVGRETLNARLEMLFGRPTTTSTPLIVVLIGMGGAGKTQLALQYCLRMKDSRRYRAIFWLDASSRSTLYGSMEIAAKQLLPNRLFDDPDAAVALVKDVLSSWNDRWLLVFDNLDNPKDLRGIVNFFPVNRHGCILITSRYAGSKELGQTIELDHMEKDEGLQLLLRSSGGDTDELEAAEEILSLLGNHPLAIDQARAYISKRQLGLRSFVREYERRKQNVMQETPQHWPYQRMLPGKEKETPLSLLVTWEMSLSLLGVGEQATELEKVITLFSFFNPVSISERLFSKDGDDDNLTTSPMSIFKDDGRWNHLKFEEAMVKMEEQSLLQFSHSNEDEITVSLHPMVSEWLRMRLEKSSHTTFLDAAISHLICHLESIGDSDYKTRQQGQAHLDKIWQEVESSKLGDRFLEARITFGNFHRDQGRLKDAEMMYNAALADL